MNVNKMAKQDAERWARAEMFFGEGAGIRRKLLWAEISDKGHNIPGYSETFERAYAKQNMGDHAIKAMKERKRIDRSASVKRNTRGLLTGNTPSMSTTVIVGSMVWWTLRETGYDKVIGDNIRHQYFRIKGEIDRRRANRKARHEASDILS